MGSFGENLKREREMRGVDLREIADATRINFRFLQAFENEEFALLPGGVFNQGFIRSYARYLGLDEEKILGEYHLASGSEVGTEWGSTLSPGSAPPRIGPKAQWVAAAAAVLMLLGGYTLFRYSERLPSFLPRSEATPVETIVEPDTTDDPGESESLTTPAPTARPKGKPTAPAATVRAATAPPSPQRPLVDTEDLILQVAVTEESWVAIDADGATVLSRLMAPQEIRTFRSRESFEVITGNASGVILTLNGETLGPLGGHGEVKTVRLTRQDLEPPSP